MKEDEDASGQGVKLINTSSGVRVSQACDRCRSRKVKCDGQQPSCGNCLKSGLECKISDKLTRRAFPKGYTENLEKRVRELEAELRQARDGQVSKASSSANLASEAARHTHTSNDRVVLNNSNTQINNPIDQIFNLDNKGIIIGNDNLNFESQFNHLLINLNLPFLKITNSHNYLVNDPNSFLYNPSYTSYNQFHNKDLEMIYNPISGGDHTLPKDIYELFIKLVNNFKTFFGSKKELDNQIKAFFLNYNIFIPIFEYTQFMERYESFHTMYPFMFTYDDSTLNGFNVGSNDYHVVNQYFMIVVQVYAMIMMNDPTINLNLLLNHQEPGYVWLKHGGGDPLVKSLYDFLPYFNVFNVTMDQLQTYLLFLYYSLLTNNKEKSSVLASLVNSFIGILGINLNSKNLFFNDLSLSSRDKTSRVKNFWAFKILLKCFNLKFGFKPSLNTTVINPVTIDRYFQLTPEKLSSLLNGDDTLFRTLLKPSVELLNLMNIIIPSSFSPNYYQFLKKKDTHKKKDHPKHLDWILNDDDGDGNDGNLNYNFNQFLTIDKNLSEWRQSLKEETIDLAEFHSQMQLPMSRSATNNLYHDLLGKELNIGISQDELVAYFNVGLPDTHMASQLIKIQLNFHFCLIRSMNYLNFIVDKELTHEHYQKISQISGEVLNYFILFFRHLSSAEVTKKSSTNVVMASLGLDVDDDGFVINDFSVKRRRSDKPKKATLIKEIPPSPFNSMFNGLSMTIINLKKSIILQMLYLLICLMKFYKRGDYESVMTIANLLSRGVKLFFKVFVNFKPELSTKPKEVQIYVKLLDDSMKDDILRDDDDEAEDEFYHSIDWDHEEMDEDLKILRILKTIQYKSERIVDKTKMKRELPVPKFNLNKVSSVSNFLLDDGDNDMALKEKLVVNDLLSMSRGTQWNPAYTQK
ncbi:hypothetical protein DICA3_F18910 [Diutina catenulata]